MEKPQNESQTSLPPISGPDEFPIEVHLRDTLTGKTGVYPCTGQTSEFNSHFDDYLWTDGNYGCDHNRALFLYGWDDDTANDDEVFNCVSQRILIDKIVRTDTGETVYGPETTQP